MNRIGTGREARLEALERIATTSRKRHLIDFTPRTSRGTRRLTLLALFLLIGVAANVGLAAGKTDKKPASISMKSLDEQVQEIKTDVLAIAAELGNLEERLLYPSNTQVAVFVSFEAGDSVALDSARISIDGELAAHHIYSFKEIEALTKGGVQRIHTGNVPTGEHRIEVTIAGKRDSGKDFEAVESFVFHKKVDPKLLGIKLAGGSGDAKITIEDW